MNLPGHIAKQIRSVYFGGNWTASDVKNNLKDVTWKQALTKVDSFNTIATLVYHMNYYVNAALRVLKGETLNASDKYSFDHPPIQSQKDWETFLEKTWLEAESFAMLVEQMPESQLWETFSEDKYGNYFRNIEGIIEHVHYHLGQIVLIKKMLLKAEV